MHLQPLHVHLSTDTIAGCSVRRFFRSLTVFCTRCVIIGIIIAGSVGCVSQSDRVPSTIFRYNEPDGINSLDPAMASYQSAVWATGHLFNGLVELDDTLAIAPCIASSWEVDPRGTTWTFHLRTDIWFHENPCFPKQEGIQSRRVTAADVQYSLQRICDARTASTGLWAFRTTIAGADDYHAGRVDSITGITVVDDSTIRIELTKPFAPFLAVLTMPYGSVVPREAVEQYGADFGRHPVGTGPFAIESWTADVALVLQRNPRYFKVDSSGQRLPYLENVEITFLRDVKNEFLEFTRGQYDVVTQIDGAFAPAVYHVDGSLKEPYTRYTLHRAPAQSIEYYGILLDTAYPAARAVPLARERMLRQALNYAVDRHRIVTYVLHGRGVPATHGVLPQSMPGFSAAVEGYTYDPDRARALLDSAGFPNGRGCPPLVLQLGNNPRTASVAEAVQQMWKEIGINVTLRLVDFPQHLSMVRAGELGMWRTSWIGDYPDPENFLALFTTPNWAPNGPNTTHISLPELDRLYQEALHPSLTFEERAARYHEMERTIVEQAPWVFLYHDVLMRLTQPYVQGFTLDGSGRLLLERVQKTVAG